MSSDDRTPHGDPIYRHEPREEGWVAPDMSGSSLEDISDHIEKHVGKIETVWHEVISDIVHIDVHMVAPTEERPCYSLITSGMSDVPMTQPEGVEGDFRFLELMLSLPADWPMTQKDFANESHYWPVRWLKMLARLPHEYKNWLWWGHSVPNGDPAGALAPRCPFTGFVLFQPMTVSTEFWRLETKEGKSIYFLSPFPVYSEEMEMKLSEGADALLEKLEQNKTTEVVDLKRPNVAGPKSRWNFGQ